MKKIFQIPNNIVSYFFKSIIEKGKYKVEVLDDKVLIKPREEQEYYKPVIVIKDLEELNDALIHYVETLNNFYHDKEDDIEQYHDLTYFFNKLLFNMTNEDASDLASYINRCSLTFQKDPLDSYDQKTLVAEIENSKFYAQRVLESPGLETPYYMLFQMEKNEKTYELPLVRYTIPSEDTCIIYTVQMGRDRNYNYQDKEYKEVINKLNSGLKEYRNVPPNFVLSLALFIKMLSKQDINNIIIPDYLFGRYKKYLGANTVVRSDAILERILNNYMNLLCRMDNQIDGFEIQTYPNEVDSFMRIKINQLNSKNEMLNEILNQRK
ncbi:MAG: hypothetical protein IJG68_00105 [Bacilli bacterium]|nr:hypothetical protein [Bacilli bacterium]